MPMKESYHDSLENYSAGLLMDDIPALEHQTTQVFSLKNHLLEIDFY